MAYALCSRDDKLDVVGCLLSFMVWQSDETNVESRVDGEAWIPDGRLGCWRVPRLSCYGLA